MPERGHYIAESAASQRITPEFADVLTKERVIFECADCSIADGDTFYHTTAAWDERCARHGHEPIAAALRKAYELLGGPRA